MERMYESCVKMERHEDKFNQMYKICKIWVFNKRAVNDSSTETYYLIITGTVGEEKCYYGSGLDDYYWCSIGCCYYDSWSSDNDDGVCCEVEGIIVAIWNFLVLAGPGIVLVVAVVVVNFCFPCLEEKCKDLLHRLQSGFDRVCRGIDPIKTFIQKRLDNLGKRLDPVVQYFTKTNRINVMPAASTVQNVWCLNVQ